MCKHKSCPIRISRIHPDLSSPLLYGQLTDGKSQSCALYVLVQFFKSLKYKLLFLQRNTCTGIRDSKQDFSLLLIDFQPQSNLTIPGKLIGIGKQIYDNLLQTLSVSAHIHAFTVTLKDKFIF